MYFTYVNIGNRDQQQVNHSNCLNVFFFFYPNNKVTVLLEEEWNRKSDARNNIHLTPKCFKYETIIE